MLSVLLLAPLVIVTRPPRSPLFRTVAPFFHTKVIGPGPLAVVVNVAVLPSQTAWLPGFVVLLALIVTLAVTVWLSAVTSALPAPAVAPAGYVAVATPFTKFCVADTFPSTALVQNAGNDGRPVSSVVKTPPVFRCLISAVSAEVEPLQISFGLALILSCRYEAGVIWPAVL